MMTMVIDDKDDVDNNGHHHHHQVPAVGGHPVFGHAGGDRSLQTGSAGTETNYIQVRSYWCW